MNIAYSNTKLLVILRITLLLATNAHYVKLKLTKISLSRSSAFAKKNSSIARKLTFLICLAKKDAKNMIFAHVAICINVYINATLVRAKQCTVILDINVYLVNTLSLSIANIKKSSTSIRK